MQRATATTVAVVLAAGLAWLFTQRSDAPDAASAPIERLLGAGKTVEARAELARMRPKLDAATVDYLDGLASLAEGKDREAVEALERARKARPTDWRIVSAAAAATANSGRFPDALAMVETYSAAAPDDERGLVAVAQYRLDRRAGVPDAPKALAALDRIAALPRRVASVGDPTAVPDAQVRRLRTQALLLIGRGVEAYDDAKALTKTTPQDPEAWFLLGEAARKLSVTKPDESLDAYRAACALAPGNRRYGEQFAMATFDLTMPGMAPERMNDAARVVDSMLARAPDDPALLLLKARCLVRDDATIDKARDIYLALDKRELPKDLRLQVLRNHAVLLYDWKQGGREGEYLDDAYQLLRRYFELGGQDDPKLHDAWSTLQKRALGHPAPPQREK